MVRAFQAATTRMPKSKLIVKTALIEGSLWSPGPDLISLPEPMRWAQINALYRLSSAYVSDHHAEGWGLTLSDAMIFDKPVIATGFSGNLEYMNAANSFLVDYSEEQIRPEDSSDLFEPTTRWAYPNEADLKSKLALVREHLESDLVLERVRNATEGIRAFSSAAILPLPRRRLALVALSRS